MWLKSEKFVPCAPPPESHSCLLYTSSAGRKGVFALACVQALLVCVLEFGVASNIVVRNAVYVDTLSSIMVLVIGIIGSGIVVYAVGYMRDFQHHQDCLLYTSRCV